MHRDSNGCGQQFSDGEMIAILQYPGISDGFKSHPQRSPREFLLNCFAHQPDTVVPRPLYFLPGLHRRTQKTADRNHLNGKKAALPGHSAEKTNCFICRGSVNMGEKIIIREWKNKVNPKMRSAEGGVLHREKTAK
jgi:hypothetical protein